MPRIIVTSRYLKSGAKKKLNNYVKYIATRPGAVLVPQDTNTITKEKYVGYIATRPGAVKFGQHGLFSQTDAPIDLNAVAKEIANHTGNVWTHVVSLRRDDAQRMGYDTLSAWQGLVRRQMPNVAKQMKIDLAHLRWYAAFHDKKTNPHVHIVVYSTDPKEGFLTEHGIEKIRSGFANDIYADELHHIYAQQTEVRDQLKKLSADRMQTLAAQITGGMPPDAELLRLVLLLSRQLSNAKGKKQYGYLKPEVKRTVDAIFSRLAADDTIRQMYALWCEMEQAKHDVYSSAKVQFPDLTDNPQFKSVKNMIVKTVAVMQSVPPPEFTPPTVENEDVPIEIPRDGFDFEGEYTAEGKNSYQSKALADTMLSLLINVGKIIEDDYDRTGCVIQSRVDSKLRRLIRRKKMELGIKEDPSHKQSM